MLEICNTRIYGLEESVIASGYPMRSNDIGEWDDDAVDMVEDTDIKRAIKLGNVKTGTGHDNFLKGVIVQFDVKYPNYWTPQFQRYSFHDIVSSTSKMHRLTKMDIKKSCNGYVDDIVIENLNKWIDIYNRYDEIVDCVMSKYEVYMKIISNTPMGLEQSMRVTSNYLQLKTIYQQRKTHKLKEDWGNFCDWCETLPHFKEFCIR